MADWRSPKRWSRWLIISAASHPGRQCGHPAGSAVREHVRGMGRRNCAHLKEHAAPSRHAMATGNEGKAGGSGGFHRAHHLPAGLVGNFAGQLCGCEVAVVGLSRTLAIEGTKYGVRPMLSPSARTHRDFSRAARSPDVFSPDNVSPLIAAGIGGLSGNRASVPCPWQPRRGDRAKRNRVDIRTEAAGRSRI